jgi:hypothetical protein
MKVRKKKKEKNNDTKSHSHDKIQKGKLVLPFPAFKNAIKFLGPGLITGASDDDPSGIATYSQAGAKFGLGMLMVSNISISINDSYSRNVCTDWIGCW